MHDRITKLSAAIARRRVAGYGTPQRSAAERFYRQAWDELVAASGLSHPEASRHLIETTNAYNAAPDTSERATPGNALPAPLVDRLVTALEPSE